MTGFDPEVIAGMTPAEREEFERLLRAVDNRPWIPLEGPQTTAYESEADVIGYGGAAGGGKTDLGIGLALTRHENCQVFRRAGTEIRGIVDRVADVLGHRRGLGGIPPIWRNPTPTCKVIEFGSVPNLGDERKYQGRAKDLLWLDEASNFLEEQARFLMGWVRTTNPNQKCRTLFTFNPPTSSEGRWIVDFFGPWLDDKHPNPAAPGELRWFVTIDGVEREVDGPEPVKDGDDWVKPQSRTFISSRIADNPFLMGTGYMATLQAMPEPLRSQMLYGDFKAGMEDDVYQVIPTAWVDAAMDRWEKKDKKPPMDSMGVDVALRGTKGTGRDETVIMRRHGEWFDEPLAYGAHECVDGPHVAGLVLAARRNDAVVHIDVFGVGTEPYAHLKAQRIQVLGCNVGEPARGPTEDGKLLFKNWRSELWWRMREALNPESNKAIALPPNSKLRSDLCAPRWKLTNTTLEVEKRDDIVKRIGRSPDYGSALALAFIDTMKADIARALLRGSLGPDGRQGKGRWNYDPYKGI